MGFIPIDPKLQKSDAIANYFSALIQDERNVVPKLNIPQILMAKVRPGLDASATHSVVISRFKEAGIPTGPLSEGIPNSMEEFARIIIEEVFESIQNEMRIDAVVDQGMQVVSAGANAGGPVLSNGVNTAPHTGIGVARWKRKVNY